MSDWQTVFLGVIAASVLVMALIQIGIAVVALGAARKAEQRLAAAEERFAPLAKRAEAIGDETARLLTRVTSTVDRAESMLIAVEQRAIVVSDAVGRGLSTPLKEASAWVAGIQAVGATLRGKRAASDRRVDFTYDDGMEVWATPDIETDPPGAPFRR